MTLISFAPSFPITVSSPLAVTTRADAVKPLQPEALGPLEERLRGASAVQARAEALAQLAALEQRTRSSMAAGVAPQRYRELAGEYRGDAGQSRHGLLQGQMRTFRRRLWLISRASWLSGPPEPWCSPRAPSRIRSR